MAKKPVCGGCGAEMTKMWVCLKCCSKSYKDKCTGYMMHADEGKAEIEKDWRKYWEAQYEQG